MAKSYLDSHIFKLAKICLTPSKITYRIIANKGSPLIRAPPTFGILQRLSDTDLSHVGSLDNLYNE